MTSVFIDAVGIAAPGLPSWPEARRVLRGERPYEAAPLAQYAPTLLPANEQRRATATVRLAFRVGEEAIRNGSFTADSLATVFASSDADMMVSHRLCSALAQTPRLVSPTDFHNSVHNAPSGYWHIGARSRKQSSAVAGHDFSFAVGLLEALTQTACDREATLLVCYDAPAPAPLLERRPLGNAFALALLLVPERTDKSLARLTLQSLRAPDAESTLDTPLETLRTSNPAGRALPLLVAVALQRTTSVLIARGKDRLSVGIEPLLKAT